MKNEQMAFLPKDGPGSLQEMTPAQQYVLAEGCRGCLFEMKQLGIAP